jgi:hypothetical protein
VAEGSNRTLIGRIDRFLDYTFFAAMEVNVLVIPVLWLLLVAAHPAEVSLSAMTTLAAASVVVGILRGQYVDVGWWPKPGHLATLPVRAAYYGAVVAGATFVGVQAQLLTGSPWPGIGIPVVVSVLVLVPFPWLLARFETLARAEPAWV